MNLWESNGNSLSSLQNFRAILPHETLHQSLQAQAQTQAQAHPSSQYSGFRNLMKQPRHHNQTGGGNVVGCRSSLGFKGMSLYKLSKKLGQPNVTDPTRGGIAIWNSSTLRFRGYPYLSRVELIDEKIASIVPVTHYGSVYIWTRLPATNSQIDVVLSLSPNFMYDRQKKLFIVRSKCLNSAVAQATLVKLYLRGSVSHNQIINYELLKKYFRGSGNKKIMKTFKTIMKSN